MKILEDARVPVENEALTKLLTHVYVGGGFTDESVAVEAFAPEAIRARGQLYWGRDGEGKLGGVVVLVPANSPARRLAQPDEAELHLLAVDEQWRGHGLGRALVETVINAARGNGCRGLVLWTQPSMLAARHLYAQAGFLRSPEEDFERGGRRFQVLRMKFDENP